MDNIIKLVVIYFIGCGFLGVASSLIWGIKGIFFAIGIVLVVAGLKFVNIAIDEKEKRVNGKM